MWSKMSAIVKVQAQIKTDNTGLLLNIPILLTEQGVFEPLLDYLLSQSHIKSLPWMNRVAFSCLLFLDYMAANRGLFSDPSILFQNFVQRLLSGTIDKSGNDMSGLYWLPRSTSNVNQLLSALNGLTDWLENNDQTTSLNPYEQASSHQERLNYAAWYKRNQFNFLGHIKDKYINSTVRYARSVKGKRPLGKQSQRCNSVS